MQVKWSPSRRSPVPEVVHFHRNLDHYERLDEIQALNTALCFLCSINADVVEVEAFVLAHPDCLILEGTGRAVEESARSVLLARTCACSESSLCKRNRNCILNNCIQKEFVYYHRRQQKMQEHFEDLHQLWNGCRRDLMLLERDIRIWRREEWSLQQAMWLIFQQEANLTRQMAHLRNDNYCRFFGLKFGPTSLSSRIEELLAKDRQDDINLLKFRHEIVLQEIGRARRIQFRVLNDAFQHVPRYACPK